MSPEKRQQPRSQPDRPLGRLNWYILVTLMEGPNHSNGIWRRIHEISDGSYTPPMGNVHITIQSDISLGWIQESGIDPELRKRIMYQITETGRDVLLQEDQQLEKMRSALGRALRSNTKF